MVGTESCVQDYCPTFYQDVLHTIQVCKVNGTNLNTIFKQADFTNVFTQLLIRKVFVNVAYLLKVVGHSLGGAAALICSQRSHTSDYSIKALHFVLDVD